MLCDVYLVDCLALNPVCRLEYTGEQACLHFWTPETCAGDEIGWDFVWRIKRSRISFTAFCNEMTDIYRSNSLSSAKFMSRSTFVSWFFSWAGGMKIDFRSWVDPWCGHSPKILACDGTHIGMSLRLMDISPIDTAADDSAVRETSLRRYDRVFMAYGQGMNNSEVRSARTKLLHKVKCSLSEDNNIVTLNDAEITELTDCLPRDDGVRLVVRKFLTNEYSSPVQLSLAAVLKLLLSDAPVSSVLPYRYLNEVESVLNAISSANDDVRSALLAKVSVYAPEISTLLRVASSFEVIVEIYQFIQYLTQFVVNVHISDNRNCEPEHVPSLTYNPEFGTAYYFTESGNAVRTLPHYNIGDDSASSTCSKTYPQVSYGGFAHTLLWFCPIHGHCYGFHVIQGSEGRKDPFSSMFKYMPEAPEEVFYDFACSLSEYCLNREPHFFRDTRFWHDVFHGFSHKCSKSFCSSRIRSLRHVNSEICEQFNAYIQCIKYTASHLSQSHFTFFLQFFIHLWNYSKTEAFFQKAVTAMNGAN